MTYKQQVTLDIVAVATMVGAVGWLVYSATRVLKSWWPA